MMMMIMVVVVVVMTIIVVVRADRSEYGKGEGGTLASYKVLFILLKIL